MLGLSAAIIGLILLGGLLVAANPPGDLQRCREAYKAARQGIEAMAVVPARTPSGKRR